MGEASTVLVTGGSRGIGKAIALRAAQAGHDVVVHYRNRSSDAEAVAEHVVRRHGDHGFFRAGLRVHVFHPVELIGVG